MRLRATQKGQYISLIDEGQEFDVPKEDAKMFKDGDKLASWVEVVDGRKKKKSSEE